MNIFDQMLARYEIKTNDDKINAQHEVMQQIALAGLYRGGFFNKAAFYGGTCLRIFYGLERFSEDMDFSLLKKDKDLIGPFCEYMKVTPDILERWADKKSRRPSELIKNRAINFLDNQK